MSQKFAIINVEVAAIFNNEAKYFDVFSGFLKNLYVRYKGFISDNDTCQILIEIYQLNEEW